MSTCYSNESPTFQPSMRLIAAITQDYPATVTTTFDHDYITGQIVRLLIPKTEGMQQGNKLKGEITVTGTDTFTINIDTRKFDAFAIPGVPGAHDNTCAQVLPVGEANDVLSSAIRNVL